MYSMVAEALAPGASVLGVSATDCTRPSGSVMETVETVPEVCPTLVSVMVYVIGSPAFTVAVADSATVITGISSVTKAVAETGPYALAAWSFHVTLPLTGIFWLSVACKRER